MVGTYEVWLVLLSIAVAIFASYVALDLASRVSSSAGSKAQPYWLIGGALSMGCGIWSMHFIGMLAFRLPIPMAYNIPVTLLSLLFAVAASAFALHVVSRDSLGTGRLLASGTAMGTGIATMHYTGMAAMEIAPDINYDLPLLALSVCIAVAASVATLWIAFQLRTETIFSAFWKKAGSALVMGIAISGMHYTGMAAAHFAPGSICTADPGNISNDWLAASIGGFTFLFLATTLLVSVFDARLADRSSRLVATLRRTNAELESRAEELALTQRALLASEQRYRALWETSNEAILLLNEDNRIAYANPAVQDIFGHAPEDVEGRDIEMLQPPRLRAAHREGMTRYLGSGRPTLNWRSVETSGLHADGHEFPIEVAFSRLEFDGRAGFAGFIKDITDRKHAEDLLAGQKQVLETVSSNADLPQTLQALNRMVEARIPGTLCSVQLADEDGKTLRCGAADSLPAEYSAALGVIAAHWWWSRTSPTIRCGNRHANSRCATACAPAGRTR
jgi:PAS domain S-box-containing protein